MTPFGALAKLSPDEALKQLLAAIAATGSLLQATKQLGVSHRQLYRLLHLHPEWHTRALALKSELEGNAQEAKRAEAAREPWL